jgi:zinc protease
MTKLVRRVPFGKADRLVVSEHRLDNGLTVLVLEDHSAPVAAYQTWLRVGSAYEDPAKTGLAHLFEHLMFNETENLGPGVFDRKVEELGAQSNAATWLDWTYYHELLPSESLGELIALEAERLARLKVQAQQVETEREVVANERRFRVENDVGGRMSELLHGTVFEVHPYRWPTIGWMEHILGFNEADCQAFYRTYYAPNNATLVVVGDVREAEILGVIETHYGGMRSQEVPPPPNVVEPVQTAPRSGRLEWPMSAARVSIAYPAFSLGHPDHVALSTLNEVLFGGRSGRLRSLLVDEVELVSDVSGWVSPFRWPGVYEIDAALRTGESWQRVVDLVERTIDEIKADGPTPAEMEKAIARSERSFFESLEGADGKADKLGFYHTTLDDFEALFLRVERLATVTADDVVRVAREVLTPERRTVVAAEPTGGDA